MTLHVIEGGKVEHARTITDVQLVREALIAAGFPPHRPTDDWICYWLKSDMSLEAIVRIALGQPH